MSEHDVLRRFLFEDLGVRGHWVRLTTSWQTARQHQHCTTDLQLQLGQALSATVLLSANIKFNGTMILQAQGNGCVKTLVAQATNNRKIRGLIRSSGDNVSTGSLQEMFGEGRLALTVTSENGQPYQGIVPLHGDNLATALETYFTQSEQLNTRLWLFADDSNATGLLLQELPSKLSNNEDWERIVFLASTVSGQDMLTLDCEELLYRLFHQEKVRLYDRETVAFECGCSQVKIENALRMLGKAELESILDEHNLIEVNCEFCNQQYRFDRIDAEQLLRGERHFFTGPHRQH